ncbi:DivIVA family protein [uncultured delta proteobacterium]|uniref:DivIVA family protein n=1 Tax=uncultured delta proteobacterium TaxID=34034 RepID=A0A212KHU1_9DELT|nr:DivIVA family protein [uncultured delta proteobacterium]
MNRIDLINRAIPRAFFGYDRVQVDRLMQDLSDALAKVTEEKIALSARLREVETRYAAMQERETAMQEALVATKRMGDDIRATAQKEAQLILETARLKADGLLQNANARLARVMEEAAEAKKNKTLFEMKLRAVIDDHLRLLNMNRQESASLEAAAKKLGGQGTENSGA